MDKRCYPNQNKSIGFSVTTMIFLLLPVLVTAQLREMDISQIERPSGGIPVFTEHPDEAYIIIESTISNLVFSSNMEGIVEDRSEPEQGRYTLIVRPFTQIFTVNAPGYMVGRFRVQSPQARSTYHYRIRPIEAGTELIPVNFIVDQPGIELFVDDQEVPVGQTVRLEPGPQQVRIEKPGFRTIIDEIDISSNNTLFQYSMDEIYEIPVTIRSNPPGATVYINTVRQDRETNFQDFFYPGEYLVRLTMSGYRDAEKQIVVSEESSNEFNLELERFVGTLSLAIEPANARITINNRDFTGQRDIALSPGIHRILVERDGYLAYDERINIEEGEQVSRAITLEPKTGVLIFSIEQADARVRLYNQGGNLVHEWYGINRIGDLPVGLYQYTAELDGFPDVNGQFAIRDNATERVTAVFGQQPEPVVQQQPAADQRTAQQREQDEAAARLEQQQREMREQAARLLAEQQERERLEQQQAQAARSTRSSFYAPRSFHGMTINFYNLTIPTESFSENVDNTFGISIASLKTHRFWATNMYIGYGRLNLFGDDANQFEDDYINVFTYGITSGLKLGLGPFNTYSLIGFEGALLGYQEFEDEMYNMMDGVLELGALFAPQSWSIGFKYSYILPFNTQEDFKMFSRHEFGFIIK